MKIEEDERNGRSWRKRRECKKMKRIRETEDYERKWRRLEKRKIMKENEKD